MWQRKQFKKQISIKIKSKKIKQSSNIYSRTKVHTYINTQLCVYAVRKEIIILRYLAKEIF